jgi:hypothetical protein
MLARYRSRATVPLMLLIVLALFCLLLARADAAALGWATQRTNGPTGYVPIFHHLLLDPPAGDFAARPLTLSPAGWAGGPFQSSCRGQIE